MTVRLLRAADLVKVCPMEDAIGAVGAAFLALSAGRASVPLRTTVPIRSGGVVLAMPAAERDSSCYSVKVVSVAPENPRAGRPAVQATVVLGDALTGSLLALLDGTALTALRTGAAGGVAARALSRATASRAAVFGAGPQARTQLQALAAVRPIREVAVVARDPGHAAAFAEWAGTDPALHAIAVRPATARDAVAAADIVVTATNSATPVFDGHWLPDGAHLTAVGSFTPAMRELDEETLRGARLVVDQRSAAIAEAGELRDRPEADLVEIGEILAGRAVGRSSDRERTVFKSVGNAIQDLAVATLAYERSVALGIGQELAFP